MITGIAIENFKGTREQVKLDFRPITLLFGANSSGKSSVLQTLHYARGIFERRNLDPDTTLHGGQHVNFDGFANLVHQHDLKREVKLRGVSGRVLAGVFR